MVCRDIYLEMYFFCNMTIGIPTNRLAEVRYKLQELRNVELSPVLQ